MDRLGGYFGSHDADDHLDYEDDIGEDDSALDHPPSPVGQDERRMQVRAYNHWAGLLGDRNFPSIEDLEPEQLDDFGPYSVLLDFTVGVEDAEVRFVGAELAQECGGGNQLVRLSDVPSRSVLSRITDHYMQILANQAPIGFEAEFVNDAGLTVLYRGILLPYSSDNETIDFIYGVINWKEMADQQTADELLLEIDQSLGVNDEIGEDTERPLETAETLTETSEAVSQEAEAMPEVTAEAAAEFTGPEDADNTVFDLGNAQMVDDTPEGALPLPAFGQDDDETPPLAATLDEDDEDYDDGSAAEWTPAPPRVGTRGLDALGNPIGAHPGAGEEHGGEYESLDDYDSGMKTAADYGLPDWDEEPEGEDVDDLVDPLADEDSESSLVSLVSRGMRTKRSVDLSRIEPAAPVPEPYENESESGEPPFIDPSEYAGGPEVEAEEPVGSVAEDAVEIMPEPELEAEPVFEPEPPVEAQPEPVAEAPVPAQVVPEPQPLEAIAAADIAPLLAEPSPEGLYDCLAAAREMAHAALTTEDRSRKTLYAAVGRAYDFSLEAEENRDEFAELIADNGLTVQDRAPMTPVVKLVFGADYDKTRLTEYAAVLTHAHRLQVARGELSQFLRSAEGGLKGVVQAERRARREEQGKPAQEVNSVRAALAKKLRKLEPLSFADVEDDGAEFALVMVHRTADGELVVLGEVPEDVPLIERAARKLLG
ncbi:hypothetical protein [Qipengyuania marisflavi]|uniref:PAS domain-containing protein n=1 Tax=Qipengyuania marisflavi TaxID=2486356 RepID=A0A5S3PB43_9SPHN|nr:hypothetical protein FEV51_08250 [Qipengyuania marisflavi]